MRALRLLFMAALFLSSCASTSTQKQAMALCREAYDVYWEYDWGKVIELSTKAIKLNPDLPWAYSQRGYAYFQTGDKELAMDDLNMAIELDPEFGAAYFNRGTLYDALGKPELAIEDYSKAIELDPFGLVYYRRGLDYFSANRLDAAETDLRKALEYEQAPFVMIALAELLCALENETECCGWIHRALDGGYDDWPHIEKSPAFEYVHNTICFSEILDSKPPEIK